MLLLVLALLGGLVGAGAYWFQPWKLATDRTVQEALPSVPDAEPSDDPADAGPDPDDAGDDPAGESPEADEEAGTDGAPPDPDGERETDGDTEGETEGDADSDAEEGSDADPEESGDTGDDSQRSGDADGAPADRSDGAGNRLLLAGEFVDHEHDTSGTAQLVELADGRRQLVLRDLDTSNGPDLFVRLSDQRVVRGAAGWDAFTEGRYVDVARLKGNRGDQVYDVDPSVDIDGLTSVSIWCKRFSVSFGAASLRAG
ncbi:electron transfer DM13 [Micromonospora endolithica]|nr:electron transfer DM13 [Micromonospora endolithica]